MFRENPRSIAREQGIEKHFKSMSQNRIVFQQEEKTGMFSVTKKILFITTSNILLR